MSTPYDVNGKTPLAAWIPSLDTVGNDTTTLTDLIGTNSGTLTNMTPASDWVADTGAGGVRALDFDGTNDYVAVPSFNLSAISVSAWVFITTDSSSVFAAKRSNLSYSWEIGRNAANDQLFFRINDNGIIATGGTIPLNQWTHIVGTYGGASMRAYVNGALVATNVYSGSITQSSVGITLGARANFPGAEAFSPQRLDDIRVFNQAIDSDDVAYLYAGGFGRGVKLSSVSNRAAVHFFTFGF